jgi:hypothetical protein
MDKVQAVYIHQPTKEIRQIHTQEYTELILMIVLYIMSSFMTEYNKRSDKKEGNVDNIIKILIFRC